MTEQLPDPYAGRNPGNIALVAFSATPTLSLILLSSFTSRLPHLTPPECRNLPPTPEKSPPESVRWSKYAGFVFHDDFAPRAGPSTRPVAHCR
ncbi:hypothetical protein [Hymenobacter sp. HDW8]|uniref:hypothetical protein n=1 Tax=Hymenobacter sp. HDW8 TaxID=2714932 RepID=UPI00140A0327|nr:hypothetical protein [Hymenobacter sp. HDW8]QIL74550.1 hypothetical protein G7064_00745 [Hymenobacter sp. HDW8]